MFWECHAITSSIDRLFDQPEDSLKLQDFLDESDLIQECLTQNKRLLDYLVQTDVMNELISHIIRCPIDDNFRNAHIVSELLSGDFPRIQEALLEKNHMNHFYSFLLTDEEQSSTTTLNPILASYFSRIIMTLIIRKPAELFSYFKTRTTFKEDFLRHLDTTSISDILYRLIADCADHRTEAIQWYEQMNLIDGILEKFFSTDSIDVQINIVNILNEFLRLAFEQQINNDQNEQDHDQSSSFSLINTKQYTPMTLARHILSRKNLQSLFETMSKRSILVSNGCDFLVTIIDLLIRSIPEPFCISSKQFFTDERFSSNYEDTEEMQINDESNDSLWKNLHKNSVDPLIRIYLVLIDIIPSYLPSLISLLSIPSAPLTFSSSSSSPSHDSSQTVKYQFISEPLGSMRLNLIKFITKLIYLVSNDYTGDHVYQILNINRLLHVLIDLFHHHIYNNFLHTQVYSIIRLILHINALAVQQPDDIWTRTPFHSRSQVLENQSSSFDYKHRGSYRFLQTLLEPSSVNLIERSLDEYELNLASNKSITTSSSSDDAITSALLHARFTSPNSGHVVQILRCLRQHASTFSQYSIFIKNDEQSIIDDSTSVFDIRWQTALDYLNEDEKKSSTMHQQEQNEVSNFRNNGSSYFMAHIRNDSNETNHRRQTFHMRSFGITGAQYIDDEDDDDDERLVSVRKISFEPQIPSVFGEQTSWYQENNTDLKTNSMHSSVQREKSTTTESNFEQLCSLRANSHESDPLHSPFEKSELSVNENEEEFPDEF